MNCAKFDAPERRRRSMQFSYALARQDEMARLFRQIQFDIEVDLFGDGSRQRPPFVPCPENIGNDPCDPWPDDYDDYEY